MNASLMEFEKIRRKLDSRFYQEAVRLILEAEQNKCHVHITGIGKPGHVAGYIASLLSSTGTPAYVLHGTEAVHGSAGQVVPGDVVIAISNSGETEELKATIQTLKSNGARIIAVSGNPDSWLAKHGDVFLYAGVEEEGDSLNMAPRASIVAEILVLQGLSLVLQSRKELSQRQYLKWHPGGSLGKRKEQS
ncbi:hypothetical protein P22_3463 [Propionispora sp. 2/2-37]|nr:SIS domain-containing protein [Propionispora sp. 2/2-37]CUH97336.1 hypothetical protein P22_3463 [Propionispora sp. 2/2-37]